MPKLREKLKVAVLKQSDPKASEVREVQPESSVPNGYTKRSPILRAYEAGLMPPDHKILLEAIKREVGDGVKEGTIQLEKVLQATGYLRASALKMLHHMQNFGVLETEPRYRATWVKLLKGYDSSLRYTAKNAL